MPTYRYECRRCGALHEIFQSITDKPRTRCLDCGGKLDRLIGGGGGVILKGSGFYTTDYRSDSYRAAHRRDAEAAKSSGTSSGKKKSGGKGGKKSGGKSGN